MYDPYEEYQLRFAQRFAEAEQERRAAAVLRARYDTHKPTGHKRRFQTLLSRWGKDNARAERSGTGVTASQGALTPAEAEVATDRRRVVEGSDSRLPATV